MAANGNQSRTCAVRPSMKRLLVGLLVLVGLAACGGDLNPPVTPQREILCVQGKEPNADQSRCVPAPSTTMQ
jgi:hypothetical protein